MQGSKEVKIPESQLNKSLLSSLGEVSHRRWAKVFGFIATLVFTLLMAVASIAVWHYLFTTPMCQQNGTCLVHSKGGPSTTINYPQSMAGMGK